MPETSLYDFADVQSEADLRARAKDLVLHEGDPVRSITFISDSSPSTIIEENWLPAGFSIELEERNEFQKGTLTRRLKGSGEEYNEEGFRVLEEEIYLIQHDPEDMYTIFSISDRDYFENCLKTFIQGLPSAISMSFLSTEEMRKLFSELDNHVDGKILATKAVVKSPSDTDVKYFDDSSYREVFNLNEVVEQDFYVDKVEFELKRSGQSLTGQISRRGESRFVGGDSNLYFGVLLESLAKLLSDKGDLFEGKAREYGSREADRIQIEYEDGSIEGTEENIRLIEALDGISQSSVNVYHKNPYMHASILDYEDGTSADVFLTSDNNISIVPGFNASRKTLSRICDHINEAFLEGETTEGKEVSKDFDDYFVEG